MTESKSLIPESEKAYEFVKDYFTRMPETGSHSRPDHFLMELWMIGFKLAPHDKPKPRKPSRKGVAKGYHGKY